MSTHIIMCPELYALGGDSEHAGEESTIVEELRECDVISDSREISTDVGYVLTRVIPERPQVVLLCLVGNKS